MAKVSIIIPIFNLKKYMEKSVLSVLEQTEKDIEVILVDDGSNDGSEVLCDEFAENDTRIKVIHQENGGLASARNIGVKNATGQFVMFLDGDDYLRYDAVERLLTIMKDYPCDFIQFCYQEVKEEKVKNQISGEIIFQATSTRELFKNLYKWGGVAASGCTKLMHKELAESIPFVNIQHEDEMWCTQAFQNNLSVTYISDELYFYVMRENSIIHGVFNHKKLDILTVSEERVKVLKQCHLEEFLHYEYNRIFMSVVSLYCQAYDANDKWAMEKIKETFYKYKTNIKLYGKLSGKWKILFRCMFINFNFILFYQSYRKKGR